MDKEWYEIVIENWSQIAILLGMIGFIIKSLTNFWLKKQEILFSRLQENKILEIKAFYKSYQKLNLELTTYLYQTRFGKHSLEIFNEIKENIRKRFVDFNYNTMTVRLFLDKEDLTTIDEIESELESIAKDLNKWHADKYTENRDKTTGLLSEIMDERLPKKLPELINKIETSLRNNLRLK